MKKQSLRQGRLTRVISILTVTPAIISFLN